MPEEETADHPRKGSYEIADKGGTRKRALPRSRNAFDHRGVARRGSPLRGSTRPTWLPMRTRPRRAVRATRVPPQPRGVFEQGDVARRDSPLRGSTRPTGLPMRVGRYAQRACRRNPAVRTHIAAGRGGTRRFAARPALQVCRCAHARVGRYSQRACRRNLAVCSNRATWGGGTRRFAARPALRGYRCAHARVGRYAQRACRRNHAMRSNIAACTAGLAARGSTRPTCAILTVATTTRTPPLSRVRRGCRRACPWRRRPRAGPTRCPG